MGIHKHCQQLRATMTNTTCIVYDGWREKDIDENRSN